MGKDTLGGKMLTLHIWNSKFDREYLGVMGRVEKGILSI